MSSLSPVFLNDFPSDSRHLYIYCLEYQQFRNNSKYLIVENGREIDPRSYKIEDLSPYTIDKSCDKKMVHPYIYVLGPNTDSKGWQYSIINKKENNSKVLLDSNYDYEESKSEKYLGMQYQGRQYPTSIISSWSNKSPINKSIHSVRRRLWVSTISFEKDKEYIKNILIQIIRSSNKIFFSGKLLQHKSSTEFIQKYVALKVSNKDINLYYLLHPYK
jgi:hypothetical protein